MAFKTVGDHGRLLYNTTQEVMPMFYKADTGELIHKCRKSAEEGGDIPYKDDAIDMEKTPYAMYSMMWKTSRVSSP